MVYKDRKDAGKRLAERLTHYRDKKDVIVLGLPRGGVTVAWEIARALHCPLDILIVRKIGVPGNPELAAGAVSETGTVVLNEDVVSACGVSKTYLQQETARQKEEIARRIDLYRKGKGIPPLAGKTVILVDDGVATGATAKAAVTTLNREEIARLVLALPVASREAEREISAMVDEWVCLQTPAGFMAVGNYYYDFTQVEDDDVVAMLG
ncbi:phosphoribosyltransferase [Geobacter sp.]|uniref:phosphoribosyltransferase n=1 Tax=Geobacter sp. TaxID=46610 RepID=UPI00260726A1|nr:phosphoribosyltransferase [Geobacter sp.]